MQAENQYQEFTFWYDIQVKAQILYNWIGFDADIKFHDESINYIMATWNGMNSYDLLVMNKNGMAVYFGSLLLIAPCNQSVVIS